MGVRDCDGLGSENPVSSDVTLLRQGWGTTTRPVSWAEKRFRPIFVGDEVY